jgi:hypothetical protein
MSREVFFFCCCWTLRWRFLFEGILRIKWWRFGSFGLFLGKQEAVLVKALAKGFVNELIFLSEVILQFRGNCR